MEERASKGSPALQGKPAMTRVLLIEDSPVDAERVRATLGSTKGETFEVDWHRSLESGLRRIEGSDFDVVLLDVLLPDSYGFGTLDKALSKAKGIPIILLTSVDDERFLLDVVNRGAQDVIRKAEMSRETLVRRIHFAIDRQRVVETLRGERGPTRITEGHFRELMEKSVDGMIVANPEGTVRFINGAAQSLLGRRASQVFGESFPFEKLLEGHRRIPFKTEGGGEVRVDIVAVETSWEGKTAFLLILQRPSTTPKRRPPPSGSRK